MCVLLAILNLYLHIKYFGFDFFVLDYKSEKKDGHLLEVVVGYYQHKMMIHINFCHSSISHDMSHCD